MNYLSSHPGLIKLGIVMLAWLALAVDLNSRQHAQIQALTANPTPFAPFVAKVEDPSLKARRLAGEAKAQRLADLARTQRIAKIQYSVDQGTSWHDAPEAAGSFATTMQSTTIGLRAVKAKPHVPWPTDALLPEWNNGGDHEYGEAIWVLYETASKNDYDLRTVTARCGNNRSIRIKVTPVKW